MQCHSLIEQNDEDYQNEIYLWNYDFDSFSNIKSIIHFEKELARKANNFSKSFVRNSPQEISQKMIEFDTIIDLDIHDSSIFTEHNSTHFLTNDFE